MANPPITIGPFANVPAPGSPIASNWAQQISNYVATLAVGPELLESTNPGDTGGGGPPTAWITVNRTAPPWANRVVVDVAFTGALAFAAGGNTFSANLAVAGVTGGGFTFKDAGIDSRMPTIGLRGLFAVTPGASNQFRIDVGRIDGTGALRGDAGTRVVWLFHWRLP